MIKVIPDPSVLEELIKAFPTPVGSAERQFRKYLHKLEELIERSHRRGRDNFAILFDAYDVPLKELHDFGGSIKKQRIHKWLNDNSLSLIRNLRPEASNLTGVVALVKATELATIVDTHSLQFVRTLEAAQRKNYLDHPSVDDKISVSHISRSLINNPSTSHLFFDCTPIDIGSLKCYLCDLIDQKMSLTARQAEHRFGIAMRILRMAQLHDGKLYQYKSPSPFGRNYYKGISIQTLPKDLRGPVLGNSWEYDVSSCALSWKMKYAQACYKRLNQQTSFDHFFIASIDFLTDKNGFFDDVINATFDTSNVWSYEKKKSKIKEALQALSFGANLFDSEWIDSFGHRNHGALIDILDNDAERQRFQTFVLIEKMNSEQKIIDDYLFDHFKSQPPTQIDLAFLRNRRGWNKSKVLAFLYQHAETQMMNALAKMIATNGNVVLARIHDSIIVRNRIASTELQSMQEEIINRFGVTYFRLNEKELFGLR